MQEPFTCLPLESIAERICKDVVNSINKQHILRQQITKTSGAERNAQLFRADVVKSSAEVSIPWGGDGSDSGQSNAISAVHVQRLRLTRDLLAFPSGLLQGTPPSS